jgi:hypothetical protein
MGVVVAQIIGALISYCRVGVKMLRAKILTDG